MKKQRILQGRIESFIFRLVRITCTDEARLKSNYFSLLPMSPIGDKRMQLAFDSSHTILYDGCGKYAKVIAGQNCRLLTRDGEVQIEKGETVKLNYQFSSLGHSTYAGFSVEKLAIC